MTVDHDRVLHSVCRIIEPVFRGSDGGIDLPGKGRQMTAVSRTASTQRIRMTRFFMGASFLMGRVYSSGSVEVSACSAANSSLACARIFRSALVVSFVSSKCANRSGRRVMVRL